MTLVDILVFGTIALISGLITRNRNRTYLLLSVSILAVYALQPALPVRGLDFWLPTGTLALMVLSWFITSLPEGRSLRGDWKTLGLLVGLVLLVALTRYLDISPILTASRPPQVQRVILALIGIGILGLFTVFRGKWKYNFWLALLLVIFVVIKTPFLAEWISRVLRGITSQAMDLASPLDIRWLGYSYIAFRIIHTVREQQLGKLPPVSLGEYITYIVFFPSLTAGPIDRLDRFIQDLRQPLVITNDRLLLAGERIVWGLFKKFAIADSLALIALNMENVSKTNSTGWTWVLLYAYSFQIFFDFSGYTDIAIGIGTILGINLPENFNQPYLKPNLTQFWNNWHMSLTQWFRAYFFNPITRALRSKRVSIPVIILFTQIATMVLIGLWHGVTLNFAFWGLWHGVGLFIQNRWTEYIKARAAAWATTKPRQALLNGLGTFSTFHFVTLGWLFFALPTPGLSWTVLLRLFGAGS